MHASRTMRWPRWPLWRRPSRRTTGLVVEMVAAEYIV
jgi:hypothetical protein